MEPVWLAAYPDGVPHTIDTSQFSSVVEVFLSSCSTHAKKPAFTSLDHTINFGELEVLTRQFACFLQSDLGLAKGDRFAIMLPNLLQYPIAVLSAMRIGLIIVNIDPMYTQRELTQQLEDCGADCLLVLDTFACEVEKTLKTVPISNVIVTKVGDCLPSSKAFLVNNVAKYVKKVVPAYSIDGAIEFRTALAQYQGATNQLVDAQLTHDDLLFLQYTGGTTGVPKGVEITHRNMIANILMSRAWNEPALGDGLNHCVAAPLPMYHIFCMSVNLMAMMSMGVENLLIVNPRDFNGFVKILKKHNITGITAVTTLLRKLLDTPGFDDIDFSGLKLTFAGGMAVTSDVAKEWQQRTGCPVIEAYGLSECAPGVSSVPITMTEFTGTIGLPLPGTRIKVLDDSDTELGFNQTGELCVAGEQVMRGYWNRPDATEQVMTDDGYLRTGDYVSVNDQGFITVLDRKKDMILVSGFNVFPNELEEVINCHPKIFESAAVGIDDQTAGQVVKLFVVASCNSLTEDDIRDYCVENLTGYKRPKVIEFIENLPKSNVGKILRKELR